MGWAFLPPLQRQLGDMPLVARTATFPSQLPAWQNPSFTGTLAHRVSTDAPSGVIDGDGRGTGGPTVHSASPDLALLAPTPVRPPPVQRAVASASSSDQNPAAMHGPLTTAAPTGLPVLAVQSYEGPADPPGGLPSVPPSEVAADDAVVEGDASSEAGQPTAESSPAATVAGPSTAAPAPPIVQRLAEGAAHESAVASPMTPTSPAVPAVPARPSVGGRRLGLGAPLAVLPLVSDVPPVQRSADVPPALGSEGAEGYVEVDIPSRPSRPEEPAEVTAEPDVPTLGPATSRASDRLDAATTPDTATSAPPAMPVAPVQRRLADTSESGDTGDTAVPDPFDAPADASPAPAGTAAPDEPVPVHTEPDPVHDAPAPETGDRRAEASAPPPTAGGVQDRPVLAQRSMATSADPTPASNLQPGADRGPLNDGGLPGRELRHPGSHTAASTGGSQLQRTVGPSTGGAAGLTLQRSIDPPSPVESGGETTTDSWLSGEDDAVGGTTGGGTPAPDQPASADAAASGDTAPVSVHPPMPQPVMASTRPMLSAVAPLTSVATAPVQRAEDTTEVRIGTGPQWSPPTLTRTPGHASTATAQTAQLRSTWQRTQLPGVQRAAVGGQLQRSVDAANGSVARSSGSPALNSMSSPTAQGSRFDTAAPTLPLAAPSAGDETAVQTALVEDLTQDAGAVPAEAAAVPAMVRETGAAAPTSASPGADAPGGAAGASSPEQLEALAGRLFAPLMRRIRSEMLLDRERRGLRTDSW